MYKRIIFVGVIAFAIVSLVTIIVNELTRKVDVSYGFHEKELMRGDNNYIIDVNGKEVLQFQTLSMQEKKNLWNNSTLKDDMLTLFPNFSEIKYLIKNQIEDDGLFKQELLNYIDSVREEYISGRLSSKQAKASLLKS
ncbi:MAG: hypothetical protein DSZ07_00735 [Sulfurovum sp.]|nr:MAG: hypothetical protein DSZ07_00735 [Sulfurovum sp.]